MLNRLWPRNSSLRIALWCFFIFTLVVFIYAFHYGYFSDPLYPPSEKYVKNAIGFEGDYQGYRSYLEKLNWLLYPVFVLVIGVVVKFTWEPFLVAWKKSALEDEPVLRKTSGKRLGIEQVNKINMSLEKLRSFAIILALAASSIWLYFDTELTRKAFLESNYLDQVSAIIDDPDSSVKWLFQEDPRSQQTHLPAPMNQIVFTIMLQLEQLLLIAFGFLVLLQIAIQTIAFAIVEKVTLSGSKQKIFLDPSRRSLDFGLGAWNHALDIAYWIICLGLVIALISRFSQPSMEKDIGISMGVFALGVLLFGPWLVTVLGRRRWLHECEERLSKKKADKSTWDCFHKQKLWPKDPNKFDKVGIVMALTMYLIFAGVEATKYLPISWL